MDFPLSLILVLALPFAAAVVIVVVSSGRRRRHASPEGASSSPVHRLQSDTAAVQGAAVYPAAVAPTTKSGRERRAASAERTDVEQPPS